MPRQKTVFAVWGPLCSIRGWDWIGHAINPCNSIVQAFLALLLLEAEVWITQTVLWLKSSAASPELLTQHMTCAEESQSQSTPLLQSHGHHLPMIWSRSSCSTQLPLCILWLSILWRFWQEAFWAREVGCLIRICAFVTMMNPTFQARQKVIDSSRRLSYLRLIELSYEIAALQSICPLPLWVT